MEKICKFIILKFLSKNAVSTSAFFSKIMTRIGYFAKVTDLIIEMKERGLLTFEGFFDNTSGIIKNIKITDMGLTEYNNTKEIEIPDSITGDSLSFLKEILGITPK